MGRVEREVVGKRLEAEVAEMRSAWREREAKAGMDEAVRELMGLLGVSQEWKVEREAELRRQAVSGELHPLIAYEQIAFTRSLEVNR